MVKFEKSKQNNNNEQNDLNLIRRRKGLLLLDYHYFGITFVCMNGEGYSPQQQQHKGNNYPPHLNPVISESFLDDDDFTLTEPPHTVINDPYSLPYEPYVLPSIPSQNSSQTSPRWKIGGKSKPQLINTNNNITQKQTTQSYYTPNWNPAAAPGLGTSPTLRGRPTSANSNLVTLEAPPNLPVIENNSRYVNAHVPNLNQPPTSAPVFPSTM